MKTALETVKHEYGVNNPEATLSITVNKLASMLHQFGINSCDEQRDECYKRCELLEVLNAKLPKHLRE